MVSFGSFGHSNKSGFFVIDWKHLLLCDYRVKCYISVRRISAWPIACLLEKYGLEVDQNGLDLFLVSRLSKNPFLQRFFSLTTKLQLNLFMNQLLKIPLLKYTHTEKKYMC